MTGENKKGIDYPGVSVVFFCHNGNGKFVLNKRSTQCRDEHGRWDCGAGALELGSTPEETLKREILEEYGATVLEFVFVGSRNLLRNHEGKRTHWVTLDFLVRVDEKTVLNAEPHKFDEVEWFSLQTLPKPLHSQLPHFLEKYRKEINSLNNTL